MHNIAIIPARGGSKGIPRKNVKELCGKPLIAWTIEAALQSKYIDYVFVSTEDEEIAVISRAYGAEVPFLRPIELATDDAKTIDCVCDAIKRLEDMEKLFDALFLLQPTSPLRTSDEIDAAYEVFIKNDMNGVVSLNVAKSKPLLMRYIEPDGKLKRILTDGSTIRRQDMKVCYEVNGAIYINKVSEVGSGLSFNDNPIPYVMDEGKSIDIDTDEDFELAEGIMKYLITNR